MDNKLGYHYFYEPNLLDDHLATPLTFLVLCLSDCAFVEKLKACDQ